MKAVAQGSDLGDAIGDLNAPPPLYRFPVLLRTANEVCGDCRALGSGAARPRSRRRTPKR